MGKTIGELDIRKRHNINILAAKKDGEISITISADTLLTENVTLLVLGEYKEIRKCFHI